MKDTLATRDDAVKIAKEMQVMLPTLSKGHQQTAEGKAEYTKAVWDYFDQLRKIHGWNISPATPPIKGKVKGEYLTDFALFDGHLGNRIACESEWGDLGRIGWAFDKLRAVKADIKILIYQWGHDDGKLPEKVGDLFQTNLANCGHHHPNHEIYLFIQFDGDKSDLFIWEPTQSRYLNKEDIHIEPIA
jgi:hypothetical protein